MPSSSDQPIGKRYSTSAVPLRVVAELVGVVLAQAQVVGADAELARTSARRSCFQYSYHCGASAGGTKNSISICSNSRVRKMKLPGVISLRNDLPTCAMPNGGFLRVNCRTFLKLMKMPCAVSGRR